MQPWSVAGTTSTVMLNIGLNNTVVKATINWYNVYISNLKELLQMQNEDDYAEKLEELSHSWSKPFLEYYQSKLHQDIIKHSAKWVLEEHKVYDPYSGVTYNMSESMNAVIKRMMHWKQAPPDNTVLVFNYLQTFYVYKTMRGLRSCC